LAEAVSWAFDRVSGDPSAAVNAASGYSYEGWVASQANQAGAAGAVAALVPGAHLPALVADLAFLLHKMAYCSWGVGEICDCVVLGKPDFENILALWSEASTPEELPFRAVSKAALRAAVVAGALTVGGLSVAAVLSTKMGQKALVKLGAKAGYAAGQHLLVKALGKGATKATLSVSGHMGAKLGAKLGAKVGAKISAKMAAKGLLGFMPVVGSLASAGINYYFVTSIAQAAWDYYDGAVR
jgi:hypothetical protein